LNSRSQAWAAAVLRDTSQRYPAGVRSENDFLLAFWLVGAVYFAARREALWLALSTALALATKGNRLSFPAAAADLRCRRACRGAN